MFADTPTAPPDVIFGLAEAFRDDPKPDKINLGIGLYRDEQGRTPVLRAVRTGRAAGLGSQSRQSPICRSRATEPTPSMYSSCLLGENHPIIQAGRLTTAQTPGGTGALSVAADFLKRLRPEASAWVPDPTWANHKNIFAAVDTPVATYPYLDSTGRRLAFEQLLEGLARVAPGDIVILHGCCHNPSGVDPDDRAVEGDRSPPCRARGPASCRSGLSGIWQRSAGRPETGRDSLRSGPRVGHLQQFLEEL